jgi:hypothetical protein
MTMPRDPHGVESGDEPVLDGRAWRAFCDRLARVGEQILGPEFPGTERARVEGYRHLANQVVAWLGWAVGYPDARFPAFFRQNDLVVRWGGPNVDQVTRRARVSADGTYRIAGNMGACEDFILTVKDGDMHMERYGVLHEVLASELGIRRGDDFTLTLSADRNPDPWVPLDPRARMLNLREYYFEWRPEAPALVTIERVDTLGTAPSPLAPAALGAMLDEAAETVERSVTYWNEYLRRARDEAGTNTMGEPRHNAGGSSRISYSFGFFELADDEALVIEAALAGARFWDVQLYTLGWFEPFDYANRTTSRNHTQSHVSAGGYAHVVLAHRDPEVRNWLDTEGRSEGMLTYRWIDATTAPSISAQVVPLAAVRGHLPADTPVVTADERRAEVRARQAHVAWRYRT